MGFSHSGLQLNRLSGKNKADRFALWDVVAQPSDLYSFGLILVYPLHEACSVLSHALQYLGPYGLERP